MSEANPGKDALEKATDLLKVTVALSTGALVFSAGLTKEHLDFALWQTLVLVAAWALLAVAAASGLMAVSAIPPMLAKKDYNLENKFLTWPARIHQITFAIGILLLGIALASLLFRGAPADKSKVAGIGPELIGSFPNFPLGSSLLDTASRDVDREMARVLERWTAARKAGRSGVLLIIGSTDRVPLSPDSRRRFDANIGLAVARAETVKSHLLDRTKDLKEIRIRDEQVLTLVSGPRQTPESHATAARDHGFAQDRRVDVWAFWSWPTPIGAKP
jgi:hypothetical protein